MLHNVEAVELFSAFMNHTQMSIWRSQETVNWKSDANGHYASTREEKAEEQQLHEEKNNRDWDNKVSFGYIQDHFWETLIES